MPAAPAPPAASDPKTETAAPAEGAAAAPATEATEVAAPAAAEGIAPAEAAPTRETPSQKERKLQAFAERAARRAERDRTAREDAERQIKAAEERYQEAHKARLAAEEMVARYKRDPIVATARDGGDVEASIRSFVELTAPEKLIREANERIAKLEREALETKQRTEQQRREDQQASLQLALNNAGDAMTDDTRFPHANLVWTPEQMRAQVRAVYDWGVKNGKSYTVKETHDYLERCAEIQYKKDEARRAVIRARLSGQTPPAPPTAKQNGQSVRQPAPERRTSASGPVTRTASTAEKKRSRTLQREQEAAADLAALKAAVAKDRQSVNGKLTVK